MGESFFSRGFYSMLMLLVNGFIFYMTRQVNDESSFQMQEANGLISYVIKNLKSNPITNLQVVSAQQDCPDDFIQTPIGNFSGTVTACWDPSSYKYTQFGECTLHKQEVTVPAIAPYEFYTWKNNKFCIKRLSQGYTQSDSFCSASYRKCGAFLCVPEDEPCPISHIELQKDSNDNIINITATNNETSNSHLVFFDISLHALPCLSDLLWPLAYSMNTTLPLIQKPQGCKVTDEDSEKLDRMEGTAFFSQYPELKANISKAPLLGNALFSETILSVARYKVKISRNANFDFCMSISKQDPTALQAPLEKLHNISLSFKSYAYWLLAVGAAVALFSLYARHILKYIVAWSGILLAYAIIIGWELWSISSTKQVCKEEASYLQRFGAEQCFENKILNEFLFSRFGEIMELTESLQHSVGDLLWIALAFAGLGFGLVYWLWRRKTAAAQAEIIYRQRDMDDNMLY